VQRYDYSINHYPVVNWRWNVFFRISPPKVAAKSSHVDGAFSAIELSFPFWAAMLAHFYIPDLTKAVVR